MNKILEHSKAILPGLALCALLSYLGVKLSFFLPTIGGATLSIFLGMLAGNTFAHHKLFAAGSKFAESDLLALSIVLLGGTLSARTLLELGFNGVGFIILQMSVTIAAALFIGKRLGFSDNFRFLMASGNAVCGSSAIASTAPAIGASDEDKVITITIVNLTGTVLMILLPLLASFVFASATLPTSALIGGTLQSVGQVVAGASMVSEPVKELATIFKIVRIIFLVVVVLYLGQLKNRTLVGTNEATRKTKIKIPWYVKGFFVCCTLYTLNFITQDISHAMKDVSNIFEIVALAGIGMRVKFNDLVRQGPKASLYGLGIAVVQVVCALTLIRLLLI
ncbi:MAG: putative sulfate exporter family transporter [Acidaminococcaceae bacterium]